jgi:hypothetical protein
LLPLCLFFRSSPSYLYYSFLVTAKTKRNETQYQSPLTNFWQSQLDQIQSLASFSSPFSWLTRLFSHVWLVCFL